MTRYKLFERFLAHQLSAEEIKEFRGRLETDPQFKEEFEMHQKVQSTLDLALEKDVKSVIKEYKGNDPKVLDSSSSSSGIWKWLAFAIAATLIIFLIYNSRLDNPENYDESLFAEYYKAPLNEEVRGENTINTEPRFNKAHSLMDAGDFILAKKIFEGIKKEQGPYAESAEWFEMLCALKLNNNEETNNLLNNISSNVNHLYYKKAIKLKDDLN